MAKQLPARGLGWTDAQWDEYVREGHRSDPEPPQVRIIRTAPKTSGQGAGQRKGGKR